MNLTVRSSVVALLTTLLSVSSAACAAGAYEVSESQEEAVRQGLLSFEGFWSAGDADRVAKGLLSSLNLNATAEGASTGTYEAVFGTCQRIGRGGACLASGNAAARLGAYSLTQLRDRNGTTRLALTETGTGTVRTYTIRFAATAAVVGQPKAIELVQDGASQVLTESSAPARCSTLPPFCDAGEHVLEAGEKAASFRQSTNCAGTTYCAPVANAGAAEGELCANGVFGTPKIDCATGLVCKFANGTAPAEPPVASSGRTGICAKF